MKNQVILLATVLILESCKNLSTNQQTQAERTIEQARTADSIRKRQEIEKKIYNIYYKIDSDFERQKWLAQHTLMCYKSASYMAEACGYDEYGNRVVNQILGTKDADNSFCINRRTKIITWYHYEDGRKSQVDYQIKRVDEKPNLSSFGVMDKEGKKYVFNVRKPIKLTT